MSNIFIGEVYEGRPGINAYITNALKNGGVDVTSDGGYTITINDWNGLSGTLPINYNTSPSTDLLVFINFDEGHETVLLCNKGTLTGTLFGRWNDGNWKNHSTALNTITTRTSFLEKSEINITKVINIQNDDVSFFNLYIADSPITQNVLYIDEAGKKFVGINSYMLVEYTD